MNLTEFLLARIAEEEAVARENTGERGVGDEGFFPDYRTYTDADTSAADDFLHHFTPPRVLAECEAKRELIAEHSRQWDANTTARSVQDRYMGKGRLNGLWTALQILALPYADHPDYDQSWRP